MKSTLVLLFASCLHFLSMAQDDYFQQQVDYNIEVILDDEAHFLRGNIEMVYQNNAPTALNEIYMHLWPNAYKNIETAFAKQMLRQGDTEFYFAAEEDRGFIDSLDFAVNGTTATWKLDDAHIDIAKITLDTPLRPGGTIIISTPFRLKIPASFSRLGHVGQSYQMTQWYPKPAVYDKNGWHPMPYLNMGEFFSEFGNFEVHITLPENYVVGATGVLQTKSEYDFLDQKVKETKVFFENRKIKKSEFRGIEPDFPVSTNQMKTLIYTAERVHDFAWFADKRFMVQRDTAYITNDAPVATWTMFTERQSGYWEKSIDYVNRAVEFYSSEVGPYPYPQATAVQSALSAGGGMEYPMITVIGLTNSPEALDEVITHEVGHNWFYGILASNERDHAWLDEGLNSFYEYRYMDRYYEEDPTTSSFPAFLTKDTRLGFYHAAYLYNAQRHEDQAPDLHSDDFTTLNYGLSSYTKPALALAHLEAYIGQEAFDNAMQQYYREYAFKHPYPADFRRVLESNTQKSLDWLFDGYLFSNKKMDYKIKRVEESDGGYKLTIQNSGELNAPFPLATIADTTVQNIEWQEGFDGEKTIEISNREATAFVIDPYYTILDIDRKNNKIKTDGLFKKGRPLDVSLAPHLENAYRNQVFWSPILAFNDYDKLMVGTTVYNRFIPGKNFEYFVTPIFGIGSREVVGTANLRYHLYPKDFSRLTIGLDAKSFNQRNLNGLTTEDGTADTHLRYRKIAPSLTYQLPKKPTGQFEQAISYRYLYIEEEAPRFEDGFYTGDGFEDRQIHELTYAFARETALNPFGGKIQLEHQSFNQPFSLTGERANTLLATVEFETEYTYAEGRGIYARVYGGAFLQTDFRERGVVLPNTLNLVGQGFNDYKYDELYFGRTNNTGLWSQQINLRDGGLKAPFGSAIQDGRSNDFVFALNLKADLPRDLPLGLPVKPYFDIAYFKESRPSIFNSADFDANTQLWWSFGLALEWGDELVGIYFPLVSSGTGLSNIDDLYQRRGNYWHRISFMFNLNKLQPWNVEEEIIDF